MTVSQQTARPTNKLTAAMVVTLVVSILDVMVRNLVPEWHDDAVFVALAPVLVGAMGYMIKDQPNGGPT